MITSEIYNGQGLGNQLHCYVTTRVVALDKGLPFGIMNPHKFKCLDFMDLDIGLPVTGGSGPEGGPPTTLPDGIKHYFRERDVRYPNGSDIRVDDPKLEVIEDDTKIDGCFQSETRILHRKEEIKQWLKVKPENDCYEYASDDICILNFRGGDYAGIPDFFLHPNYWINAINRMLAINPKFRFIVITDDVLLASRFFPMFEVYHFSIAKDFTIIKNAHYLILSNSSFAYFPTFISERNKYILAPKYWGRHNISDGYWSCGYNIFRGYNYIDRQNVLFTFEQCDAEFKEYQINNKHLWQ
jgi:hypothetical protein